MNEHYEHYSCRLISGGIPEEEEFGGNKEPIPFYVHGKDILYPGSVFKFDRTSRMSFTVIEDKFEFIDEMTSMGTCLLNTNSYVKSVKNTEFLPGRKIVKLADIGGNVGKYIE